MHHPRDRSSVGSQLGHFRESKRLMTRSELNKIINGEIDYFDSHGTTLLPSAQWLSREWPRNSALARDIVQESMGCDGTDFGSSKFDEIGLTEFAVRKGSATDSGERFYC